MLSCFCRPFVVDIITARVRSTREGNVLTRVCLSGHMGEGYLPWMGEGVPTLDEREGYLPWMGGGIYLELEEGVPTLDGGGVPTLDGGGDTYLGWGEGVPTLDGMEGYLPWMGEGYLPWMGRGYLP